jgi:hypothetical protein
MLMALPLLVLVCISLAPLGWAQQPKPASPADHAQLELELGFEAPVHDNVPGGWGSSPPGTIFADDQVAHGGRRSARIERHPDSASNFSSITKGMAVDFSGSTIELRGFLRTEEVSGFAGLWMREDGETPGIAFDNMERRHLSGTSEWTEYSITLPLQQEAKQLVFGVLLVGTGKAWADDLQLLVDGKPVWEAPKAERTKTVLDTDNEFDRGSGVAMSSLTGIQIDNLVVLGKIWGFLKYHHPAITSGQHHWDYELFRVLPSVLAAPDHASANGAILQWIDKLGVVNPCSPCAQLEKRDLQLAPDLDWIADARMLGSDLSERLISIRDNRSPGKQFYVSKAREINNPVFEHELGYTGVTLPDSGFQLLSLYRFWNVVEYWSPYRNLVGEDWTGVLAEFIPRIATASTVDGYKQQLFALVAMMHDGHANLWNSMDVRPPAGKCQLPVRIRFIEGLPTVVGFVGKASGEMNDIQIGDVITALDGVAVTKLVEQWKPYYADSTDAARLRDIARSMTNGECGDLELGVRRGSGKLTLKLRREAAAGDPGGNTHDLPGPAFRLLSNDVAYLKLSSVKAADCAHYVEQASGTKGFIIDIRNYPSEFVVFALGSLLVNRDTPFAIFTEGDLSNPGAFHWGHSESLTPQTQHYSGKIVVLVDESSMSQAEYTAMALRAAPGAIVVGSTTAGADGNVSQFSLPGYVRTMISGIGVFYPDQTPRQRIGIVPNVEAKPTIAGIRSGRDEVLEEAVRQILGKKIPASEIEKMARP